MIELLIIIVLIDSGLNGNYIRKNFLNQIGIRISPKK